MAPHSLVEEHGNRYARKKFQPRSSGEESFDSQVFLAYQSHLEGEKLPQLTLKCIMEKLPYFKAKKGLPSDIRQVSGVLVEVIEKDYCICVIPRKGNPHLRIDSDVVVRIVYDEVFDGADVAPEREEKFVLQVPQQIHFNSQPKSQNECKATHMSASRYNDAPLLTNQIRKSAKEPLGTFTHRFTSKPDGKAKSIGPACARDSRGHGISPAFQPNSLLCGPGVDNGTVWELNDDQRSGSLEIPWLPDGADTIVKLTFVDGKLILGISRPDDYANSYPLGTVRKDATHFSEEQRQEMVEDAQQDRIRILLSKRAEELKKKRAQKKPNCGDGRFIDGKFYPCTPACSPDVYSCI